MKSYEDLVYDDWQAAAAKVKELELLLAAAQRTMVAMNTSESNAWARVKELEAVIEHVQPLVEGCYTTAHQIMRAALQQKKAPSRS